MQHADAAREALGEALHRLRRERDLRHQHDPAPPEGDRVRERVEVDLGLATPGDAVQQQRAAVAAVDGGAYRRTGGALLVEQLDRRARGHVQVAQWVPLVEHLDDLDEPRVAQVLDGLARTGTELARQLGRAQLGRRLRGEALEEARAGGLRPRARQLADAPLGRRGRECQPDVALPIHLDQAVGDQRLHRRRAASDPSELVERDRLAPGVEERA